MRGFDEVFCYGAYESTLRKLIHLFKYSGMRRLARRLAALLGDAEPPRDRQFDLGDWWCRCTGADGGSAGSIRRNYWEKPGHRARATSGRGTYCAAESQAG